VEQFRKRIEAMKLERVGLQASEAALLQIARTPAYEEEHDFETKRLEREYEKVHRKSDAVKLYEERLKKMEQEEEARKMISSIMRPFSAEERKMVQDVLNTIGPESEILYKDGTDTIQRGSIQTLRPGQWLNDEVVHYFLVMLAKRDEEMCRQNPSRKRSHFFKSFFFTTLLNEGHANPAINGTYEYRNVKRWSKKVPGKDIFNLDKIVIPVNVGRMHWVCVVAYMQEKRIQFYDSMGDAGNDYLQHMFRFLQDEHMDKKKQPLPDADSWQLVTCTNDTPRQRNGYDCGVFTCMFADFLSKDCPLLFDQSHVTLCRERIALSIIKGQAIM